VLDGNFSCILIIDPYDIAPIAFNIVRILYNIVRNSVKSFFSCYLKQDSATVSTVQTLTRSRIMTDEKTEAIIPDAETIEGNFTEKKTSDENPEKDGEEDEEEDEDDEEEEDDENDDDLPHPADILESVIDEIERQGKRLNSRRSGDLKFELTNNIYPILHRMSEAILGLIEMIEDEEEEPTIDPDAAEKQGKEVIDAVRKLADKDPDSPESKKAREWLDSIGANSEVKE
jgi:hypothetical protein